MEKIVIDMGYTKSKKEEVEFPACWICMDSGIAIYNKRIDGVDYEYASRCRCKKGQKVSDRVREVPDELAEALAETNFKRFKEVYPEKILEISKR